MQHTTTLGILAHVDAGKTSLTERLLLHAGVIDHLGRVDDGTTQTDSMELERQRGITIRAAVTSLPLGDLRVTLVDTPGHPDFIAEVERALRVLDGVVLVVSAVEGVQPQTRVLMRALQRLRLPTLMVVNKIDRAGARPEGVLEEIRTRLTSAVVPLARVVGAGTREATTIPYDAADPAWAARVAPVLAEQDDAVLAAWGADRTVPPGALVRALRRQSRAGLVHPVLFGSAVTGAGVEEVVEGIRTLLPRAHGDPSAPLSGRVFAVERDGRAWVRLTAGTLTVRDRVPHGSGRTARVTALGDAASRPATALHADDVGTVRGLDRPQVGDPIGVAPPDSDERTFRPASLETVVDPQDPADRGRLLAALTALSEQDPLIALRQDDDRAEVSLSLYGEVQKEVIGARLRTEFDVGVTFRPTGTICLERVVGTGAAHETIAVAPNPYLATVGLRIEPGPLGSGVRFGLDVELGSMPPAFFTAVREATTDTLRQGLHGWEVTDCVVTMTHAGYWARQSHAHGSFDKAMSSTASDFRELTHPVLARALRAAGTQVCEPVHAFRVDLLADQVPLLLPVLAREEAEVTDTRVGSTEATVRGFLPARRVDDVQQRLPTLTSGEGVWESALDHHRPVRGAPPTRRRVGVDPLDWDGWVKAHPR